MPSQLGAQALGEIHGTVLPASAAEGHGEVGAILGAEAGHPLLQERFQALVHFIHHGLPGQKLDNRRILAGQTTQLGNPMGVWQAANVEDEIRVSRYSLLETEGLNQLRQHAVKGMPNAFPDQIPQLMQGRQTGVQTKVRVQGEVRE